MKRNILAIILLCLVNIAYGQVVEYHAEWDAGVNISSPYDGLVSPTINTIHGVRFSDKVSVGAGLGVTYNGYNECALIPLYVNAKYIFLPEKMVRPFVSADIGYSAMLPKEDGYAFAGLYFSPSIGLKKGRFKFQIGYTAQQWRFTYNSSGSKYISSAGHIRFGMMF